GHVCLYGCFRDIELVGNLLVELARPQHLHDAKLLGRELTDLVGNAQLFVVGTGTAAAGNAFGYPGVAIQHLPDGFAKHGGAGGFRNEPRSAVINRASHRNRIFMGRYNYNWYLRMRGPQVDECAETMSTRDIEIKQKQVGFRMRFDQFIKLFDAVRFVYL